MRPYLSKVQTEEFISCLSLRNMIKLQDRYRAATGMPINFWVKLSDI